MDPMDDTAYDISGKNQRDACLAHFHPRTILVPQRDNEGRELPPTTEPRDYVKITVPGQKDNVDREATDDDKRRWPTQWAAYLAGKEQTPDGYPLAAWKEIDDATRNTLEQMHIYTVPQLVEIQDTYLNRIGPGGRMLKEKARKFLLSQQSNESIRERLAQLEAQASGGSPAPAVVQSKTAELESLVKQLTEQNTALAERLEALETKPKRGRPPSPKPAEEPAASDG